jgi:hypothetical protein
MKLRDSLMSEHSKANTIKIINWVGSFEKRLASLFAFFFGNDTLLSQRAAWPLSYVAVANPGITQPYLPRLISNLRKPGLHDAVKRSSLTIFQELEIPVRYHGELMTRCFDYLLSPTEKPAIKALSHSVLQKLSMIYPEIPHEIKTIIRERWDIESKAFQSRARHFLKVVLKES